MRAEYLRLPASILAAFLSAPAILHTAAHAQNAAGRAGSYAAGARSIASVNGSLNSVVGQRPSDTEQQIGTGSITYRITNDGRVLGPDSKPVTAGCSRALAANGALPGGGTQNTPMRATPGHTTPQGDAVLIGTAHLHHPHRSPIPMDAPGGRTILMNASFGPAGAYITPDPCHPGSQTSTPEEAAHILAAAGGNPFALAGNRATLIQATAAHQEGNDVILTGPAP